MATVQSTLRYCMLLSIKNPCSYLQQGYIEWCWFVPGFGAAGDVLPHGGGAEGG